MELAKKGYRECYIEYAGKAHLETNMQFFRFSYTLSTLFQSDFDPIQILDTSKGSS